MKEFEKIVRYRNIGGDMFEASEVGDLVRCRGCKYHDDELVNIVYCPNIVGGWVDNNFFCADGERKDEVEE